MLQRYYSNSRTEKWKLELQSHPVVPLENQHILPATVAKADSDQAHWTDVGAGGRNTH